MHLTIGISISPSHAHGDEQRGNPSEQTLVHGREKTYEACSHQERYPAKHVKIDGLGPSLMPLRSIAHCHGPWLRSDSDSLFFLTSRVNTPVPWPRFRLFSNLNLLFALLTLLPYLTGLSANAAAEIPITSSGLNTQISSPISIGGRTQYDITGGARVGANVFHSFGQFDVPHNTIANFRNDSLIKTDNILGRVSGGSISDIFGTIQTTDFGRANLFLMNPAGFVFGPHANLNVGGAVTFTSADYLKFEDGRRLSAAPNPAADAVLSAFPVAAFGFLGSNPGAITIRGSQLEVTNEKGISLVGGNITLESTVDHGTVHRAQLFAPNGQIQLATAASPGEFPAEISALTLVEPLPNINGSSLTAFGALSLAPHSAVRVSGGDTVSIRGGQFILSVNDATFSTAESIGTSDSVSLAPDSAILSSTSGAVPGAKIQITTGTLQIDTAEITSRTFGAGHAGSVEIIAHDSIRITNNSSISAFSDSTEGGAAGHIILRAPSVELLSGSLLSSSALQSGNAGNISVHTNILNLSGDTGQATDELNGAVMTTTTAGSGAGGNISILGLTGPGSRAFDVTLSSSSSIRSEALGGTGNAGNITVETVRLSLLDDAKITTTSRENSPGNAGGILVNATESVLISNSFVTSSVREGSTGINGQIVITTPDLNINQGLVSTDTDSSSGNAGVIIINSNSMTLTNGGRLSSSRSVSNDLISLPQGTAGTVIIQGLNGHGTQAESILISGQNPSGLSSGIFTDTQGTGAGGNIKLHADQIRLDHGATVTANSAGAADAGNIHINATNGLSMQNSSITSLVTPGSTGDGAGGGNIKITTSPSATIHLRNSTISASVPDGRGGGGDISIDPQLVILQNSKVLAQADEGTGGRITVIAQLFMPDADSVVNADSGQGVNGTVTIQSPASNLSGTVGQLVSKTTSPQVLIHSRCAALVGGLESTFIFTGRGTLPNEPGGWLFSSLPHAIAESKGSTMTDRRTHTTHNSEAIESPFLSLRQRTPSGFLTRAFPVDGSVGCGS